MTIILNGERHETADGVTVAELLDQCGYVDQRVAVAVNRVFVPRGQQAATTLKGGDDVEVVAPMPGG